VPDVAEVGEVKEVADGYGRNFLIPKRLAVLPGSQASSIVKAQLKVKARRQAETEAEMARLGKQLEGKEVTVKAKVGANDRLYGSITNTDIAEELERSAGVIIDKRKIEIEEPIRQVGKYEVTIRLTKDAMPKIKLIVMGEEEKEEEGGEKEGAPLKKVKGEKKEKAADQAKAEEEKPADEVKAEKEEKPADEVKAEKEEQPADEVKAKKGSKTKAATEKKAQAKKKIQAKKKVTSEAEKQKPAEVEEQKPAEEGAEEA